MLRRTTEITLGSTQAHFTALMMASDRGKRSGGFGEHDRKKRRGKKRILCKERDDKDECWLKCEWNRIRNRGLLRSKGQ